MLLTYAFREISGLGAYTPVMSCEGIISLFIRASFSMYLMKLVTRFLLKHEPILFLYLKKKWKKFVIGNNERNEHSRTTQALTHTANEKRATGRNGKTIKQKHFSMSVTIW